MKTFLELVASDLLATFGRQMSHVCVVFPSQRARLFFYPLLQHLGNGTMWAPRCTDMSSLVQSFSTAQLLDPVEAVCLLHGVYSQHVPEAESLDEFFGWGRVLLADFDDIDKHMVDARQLFANITSLHAMDSLDFLSEEQLAALKQFFSTFSVERHTELKERFVSLWSKMNDIYTSWHSLMQSRNTMTEGAMFRQVVEQEMFLKEGDETVYAFVGFNVLDTVEERLMLRLQKAGRARFYWDYDRAYMNNPLSEAAVFMRRNLEQFHSPLPPSCFDNLSRLSDVTFVAASGENVQARYVEPWIKTLETPTSTANAVVLCNEAMLHPVLHAIPDAEHGGPSTANITMGYPVAGTPVATYLAALAALQVEGWDERRGRFYSRHRRNVEQHPLFHGEPFEHVEGTALLLDYLRQHITTIPVGDDDLMRETVFRLYTMLTRLFLMANEGSLNVSPATMQKLLTQAVQSISVPFHGEPVKGLQVMGVLETRCLDFENLLLLSTGEGYLPQNPHTASFIPYHLRKPFGLTTIEHKVAVQAYYFYRLLQRAKSVTCVYNTAAADGVKNEMSRFLRQLLADTQIPVRFLSLAPALSLQRNTKAVQVDKTPEVMEALRNKIRSLAPTAINTYLECPLRFYLENVAGYRKDDTPDGDTVDNAMFGTIFHDSAEEVYKRIGHQHITAEDLEYYVGPEGEETPQTRVLLAEIVRQKFDEDYFDKLPAGCERTYTGQMLIQRDVLTYYLRLLLLHDYRQTPFQMLAMEQWCYVPLKLADGTVIGAGGKIDRVDLVTIDGRPTVRIVDYKTGVYDEKKVNVPDFDSLFQKGGYALQTFVYSMAVCQGSMKMEKKQAEAIAGVVASNPVVPALFFVQQAANTSYNPTLTIGTGKQKTQISDFHDLAADTQSRLQAIIEEMFDHSHPFTSTVADGSACTYCPFTHICH